MNPEELRAALQVFYDNYDSIGVSVYAILKDENDLEPKRVDIEAEALDGIKELFIDSLRKNISDKEGLSVLNLSTADERIDAVYLYDIDIPEDLQAIESVTRDDNLPLLNLQDENLSNIKALLIEIGNHVGQIVLYKTMAPVNIFSRSSFFLKKDQHRLEQINDEFLRISAGFQMVRIAENLFVLDLATVEKSFGFHDVIIREATVGMDAIRGMDVVENPESLEELLADVKYARRFTKVARSSPVIQSRVPNTDIINFCRTFPTLAGKIRFNDAGDKVLLDTQVSKDLFIKLLMDNFLTSELTRYHYESVAKDQAEAEIESEDNVTTLAA